MLEIAKYFASIGLKVPTKELNNLDKTLKQIESTLLRFTASFDTASQKIERGLAKAQMAQKRQFDIEGKQLRNATLQQKLTAVRAKTENELAKAKLATARAAEKVNRVSANGDAWKFGPSFRDMMRLKDGMDVREKVQQSRDAWRSRRRVTDVGIAEELAYEADARRTSWRRQKRSPIMGGISIGSSLMRGALPGFGAVWSAVQLNKISQELDSISTSMIGVAGSTSAATEQMNFLNGLADEFGLTVRDIGPEYVKFFASAKGTSVEPFAQSGFKSFVKYGSIMGLSKDDMKGSLTALQQMIGKGYVMSEELDF